MAIVSCIVGAAVVAIAGMPAIVLGGDTIGIRRELIDRATEPWNRVNRWLVEYEAVPSATTEGVPVHRVMAVASPGSFYHFSAHFSSTHPWQADPFCQEFFISRGMACHQWPFNRTYSQNRKDKGERLGGTSELDFLLAIVPKWPLTDFKSPINSASGATLIPTDAMRSTTYRLLLGSEAIGGEDCAVFDRKGVDRIWVATGRGICVMRRDIRNPSSGRLGQRILADQVEEIAPGLWLPTTFRSQFFSAKQKVADEIIEREYRVHILRCLLNDDVPASVFTPVHRPGSLKYESASQFTQMSPGGEDLLSDIVNFAVRYAHLPTKPFPHKHPYVCVLGGLASGVCVGLVLFGVPMKLGRKKEKQAL